MYPQIQEEKFNGVPIRATPAQEKVKGGKRYVHKKPR
jgi:hypothetical protein